MGTGVHWAPGVPLKMTTQQRGEVPWHWAGSLMGGDGGGSIGGSGEGGGGHGGDGAGGGGGKGGDEGGGSTGDGDEGGRHID